MPRLATPKCKKGDSITLFNNTLLHMDSSVKSVKTSLQIFKRFVENLAFFPLPVLLVKFSYKARFVHKAIQGALQVIVRWGAGKAESNSISEHSNRLVSLKKITYKQ